MEKIFITGNPACGKTTLIKEIGELLKIKGVAFSGFITEEIREKGFRKGFTIEDLKTKEKLIFASLEGFSNIKFGKYFLNIENFERIALKVFDDSPKIVLIDEIGKMEFYSNKFRKYFLENLQRNKNIVGTLHRDFVKDFEQYKIYTLTRENYQKIKHEILTELQKMRIL
ncbi:NTPase [Caldisericum exile]|uniref:Nucleoside-triphosphatase n=1 Tax=Caldisericum exile (strain DSM 21853 / NBRC 104410 / AZM16c01) TaxID=511051 RepID=A0A7U6GDB0_CALEA|nr:NTPase [Caldisericum exile]BAL80279.1 nucleoside-triphosphatase [Caldisericum exile AZM16c01]